MQLVPAIDLLGGAVVRLHQGDYAKVTEYPIDPVAYAAALRGKVARLHVVDLEGARTGTSTQRARIAAICAAFGEGVQVGGGVRDRAAIEALRACGVSRVVMGTKAVRDPAEVRAIAEDFPDCVILAVDARDGKVAIDGWTTASTLSALDVARTFDGAKVDSLLFTDVSRDGTRQGPAVESTAALAIESGRPVLASGGVGALDDLRALARASRAARDGILGVVVGRALLDGSFSVDDAIAACAG
jgi:phosphoribosylformimino-5-aminoimidazole carboxamide ribotide isomerase